VTPEIETLVRNHRPAGPLVRDFYLSPMVFEADMARIFRRHWLYVAHTCMLPNPGDWVTWCIGTESVIVVRGQDDRIRAFHNTCRHRGSRICRDETGHASRLVCPYHRWTYDLDGRLMTRTEREFGVKPEELGLQPIALRETAGLVWISLADEPPDFDAAANDIATRLRHHGMDRAKVAKRVTYRVKANWKLVFENNRECYHCTPNHPEYVKGTYDVARADARQEEEVRRATEEANARFASMGLDTGDAWSGMTGAYWRAHRTPLVAGWSTQSLDGEPVAPLMGAFRERGEWSRGTLRTTVFPNFWQHASDDHAVATRITPTAADECVIDVWWIVDKDAVEGRDYDLAKLMPFWQCTSEQDWRICEDQQLGVSSSRYVPGPYAKNLEANVAHFVDWYLREMLPRRAPLKALSA
jgi:glycine betaine catabolism A